MRFITIATLGLMLFAATPSYALTHQQFSVGGGFNLNFPRVDSKVDDMDEMLSVDWAVGAKEEMVISGNWLLRTGLWFQQKSAKFDFSIGGNDGDVSINTVYLSVPLNVQYQFAPFFGLFGGYIADFRLNDHCQASGTVSSCKLYDDSESVVHNATVGASFDINAHLNLTVNYQHGLTDVYKDGYQLSTLSFMAFYKF